jgi:hypothetical protein
VTLTASSPTDQLYVLKATLMGIIKNLRIASLMTITTTVLLGVIYPLYRNWVGTGLFPWPSERRIAPNSTVA